MRVLFVGGKSKFGTKVLPYIYDKHQVFTYDLKNGDNVFDYGRLINEVKGTRCLIHGMQGKGSNWGDCFRENVKSTSVIIRACEEENVTRLIYISTLSVYEYLRRKDLPKMINIDNIKSPQNYALSKWMAEKIILDSKIPYTIILRVGFVGYVKHAGIIENHLHAEISEEQMAEILIRCITYRPRKRKSHIFNCVREIDRFKRPARFDVSNRIKVLGV